MKVAVLGCGPAGLIAAHAVRMAGHKLVIISRKRKSPLFGAQYLHAPVPGVTHQDDYREVRYQLNGTPEMYRRKVYGKSWDGTVSPEDLLETHKAWDIRETYDRLWAMYADRILDAEVEPAGVRSLVQSPSFDMVVNTIPLDQLCHQGHVFRSTEVVAAGDAPAYGIKVSDIYKCPEDTVRCNGQGHPSWYRMSNIFGHTTVEWPTDVEVPVPTASKVTKPTSHNCDCWPNILKVGRYGSWTKGVLSHEAYDVVSKAVA